MRVYYFAVTTTGVVIRTDEGAVFVDGKIERVRYEQGAPDVLEWTLGRDGQKIVAEPPGLRQAQEPESPDGRSAEMVEALSGRTPEKNGLVEYIEKTAGGNGTPALRQAQGPAGAATGASAPSTSSGTTGAATGATVENMGGVLRAWMNMEGMSQAHLSVKSGVNEASVSRHIRNLDPIGPRALEKYARVFGVSVKEFLAKPAEEKPEPDPGAVTVLKKWLLMSGKIQADIRRALGVSSGELSNQVAGKNKLTPRRQAEYAKFFGVSVEEFLRGPSAAAPSTSSGTTGAAAGASTSSATVGVKSKKDQTDQTKNTGKATGRKKQEPEDLEPLAAAYCEMCRAVGDGYCEGCAVREMLKAAARQETPGEITQNAKQAVCSRCKTRKKGECGACRLKSLWAAKEAFGGGESIADAVANAEAEYQAAVALEKE